MRCSGILLATLVLASGHAICADDDDDDSWQLNGRVLDQDGEPVADVAVTNYWNANGISLSEFYAIKDGDGDKALLSMNEGQMEPWGLNPTMTDADGNFTFKMDDRDYKLLAIDKQRQRGALIVVDPHNVPARVEVRLVPLIRLRGEVQVAATGDRFESVTVVVRMPLNSKAPLGHSRLALCSSAASRFEFLLPPGDYEIEAFGHISPTHVMAPHRPITLESGQTEVDCGTLELTPERPGMRDRAERAKQANTWIDYTQLYGQPLPKWHAVAARGISKDAQISDFQGKWVLVYAWGLGCAPCLARELPALMDFYNAHEADRDRFEIVSICLDPDGDLQTMADLDRALKLVVDNVWNGRQLPFPILLDNTYTTSDNFGLEGFGYKFLVDPSGRLVKGDENTLAEQLKENQP